MTRTDIAVSRRTFAQVWKGSTAWAVVFGATAAASALTYVNSFPTPASRDQIAASTGRDAGLAILLGPVSAIGTVGGYTFYKGFVFLTTIGAIWAVLAATRFLRGEEDAGRWQLFIAGETRASRATTAVLIALGAGVAVIFAGTTLLTGLAARNPDVGFGIGETIAFGLSIAIVPAVFVVVGALTSQLARTRRVASALGLGVFGVTFVLRMIADSAPGTRWLLWSTPFGWSERMRPFTENDLWPLLPALVVVVALGATATVLASRRDIGWGVFSSRDVTPPRRFGLRSAFGLASRRELPVLGLWCFGAAAGAFAFGIISKVATGSLPESLGNTLDRFRVHGAFLNQFVGVAFLFIATVVALVPAGQIGAAADEETSGRLVHVLVAPNRRGALLGGRLALAGLGIVAAGVFAGLATWAGAKTQGIDLGFQTMLHAGLNVVPTALVVLGIGAVVLAFAVRAAVAVVYAVVIGSLLVDILSAIASGLQWLDKLSVFHYMALVPAQRASALNVVVTCAVAVLLCTAAVIAFDRRDLQTA